MVLTPFRQGRDYGSSDVMISICAVRVYIHRIVRRMIVFTSGFDLQCSD